MIVASLRQRLSQSKPVCRGPNRSGRSRRGEPVLRIQNQALTIVRWSRNGRPLPTRAGNRSAISSHCSSVIS